MTQSPLTQRQYNLDYLRFFASIAIILLHVAGQNMKHVELASTEWNILNFYNGAVRWGVPVFVMMSGALFLSREIPIKTLYKKYVLRMAIAYIVWSLLYGVGAPIGKLLTTEGYQISVTEIMGDCISGAVHLWFIPMIIGLYMCLPLIKAITKNDTLVKYFLILAFIFVYLYTEFKFIAEHFGSEKFSLIADNTNTLFKNFNINLVAGYVPYFTLGYYLNKTDLAKKTRIIIYALGCAGFIATIILNMLASINAEKSLKAFYNASTLNVLLMSVAMFIWFKYNAKGTKLLNKIIVPLSKYSFGAFLAHIFVLQLLSTMGLDSTSFNPLLSVPVITIVCAIISYLISFILNKIPVIKKYIV